MIVYLGKNAHTYSSVTGWDSPSWLEQTMARNVTLNLETGSWDASRRGIDWKAMVPTLKSFSAEMDMLYQPSNPAWAAMMAAYLAGSMIDMLFLDGGVTVTGSQGLRAEMAVFSFPIEQPLEEGLSSKVKLEFTLSDHPPTWVII